MPLRVPRGSSETECCLCRPVRPYSFLGFGYLSRFSRLIQHLALLWPFVHWPWTKGPSLVAQVFPQLRTPPPVCKLSLHCCAHLVSLRAALRAQPKGFRRLSPEASAIGRSVNLCLLVCVRRARFRVFASPPPWPSLPASSEAPCGGFTALVCSSALCVLYFSRLD